jgi:hypothetical protein
MMRMLTRGILLFSCLMLTACASRPDLSGEFDRSVKAYNRMLRWHEIENAGMTYIDPDQREQFLKQAETLKKRGLSVTDFRILSSRYIPERKAGDAVTEFDYYILPSNRIKTISYRQEWVYQENIKSWKLKSGLPLFE